VPVIVELLPFAKGVPPAPTVTVYESVGLRDAVPLTKPPAPPPAPLFPPLTKPPPPPPATWR